MSKHVLTYDIRDESSSKYYDRNKYLLDTRKYYNDPRLTVEAITLMTEGNHEDKALKAVNSLGPQERLHRVMVVLADAHVSISLIRRK